MGNFVTLLLSWSGADSKGNLVTALQSWSGYIMINRELVLRSIGKTALLFVAYRTLRFIIWYRRRFNYYNNLQGVKDFSWKTGNLHLYPFDFEKRVEVEKEWMKKFPKYYRIWFGPLFPLVRVYHPDTIRNIIKSTEPKPLLRGESYRKLVPWLGMGLLIAGGQRWSRARRLLTPAFNFEILKPYVKVSNEAIDTMIEKIDRHVEAGTSFELFNMISLCTLDILLRCAMSVEEDIQTKGSSHPYVNASNTILNLAAKRGWSISPLNFFDFVYYLTRQGREFKKNCDYVHKWAEEIIGKRQQTLERDGPPKSRYLDFLDILLSARDAEGKGLTPLEIRNEVDTFLFEGHDTTTSAISWTLHTLASTTEMQTRVQEELDSFLGKRKSKHITWDDIPKLEYLTRCLKEGMRYHSPVPYIYRHLEREMDLDGTVFPIGTVVGLGIWNVHHNPDVWEEPEKYDPDRFLLENIKNRDRYAYIPFSAGPRNCIGQHFALHEAKVTMGRILERYRLEPDASRTVAWKHAVVMKSTEGLWVFAKHRN